MPYDRSVALIKRTLPEHWFAYTAPDGTQWRLAPNGYWWRHLRMTDSWYQATSPADGYVFGMQVPWLSPLATAYLDEAAGQNARDIRARYGVTIGGGAGGAGGTTYTTTAGRGAGLTGTDSLAASQELLHVATAQPNIPPDFAAIEPGPGACQTCHLDDGPLYDGSLCRYCWMLAQLPTPITHGGGPGAEPAATLPRARPLRQPVRVSAVRALSFLFVLAWIALAVYLDFTGRR